MFVAALNGSPNKMGNTYLALSEVCAVLNSEKIDTEILHIGGHNGPGCIGCNMCLEKKRCVLNDDQGSEWIEKISAADGIILGAPAYFGSMPGPLKSFLDRLFFQDRERHNMRYKVGAALTVLRRSGSRTTLDDLTRFFHSSEILIAPSANIPAIHGTRPGEILQDTEGMDALRKLGTSIAWLLKVLEKAKSELPFPEFSERVFMNFIR